MARQPRAIRTRNAVLTAAAEVFARRGYEAANIAEILTQAQVTKGALYFHFASKEELARGVLEHAVTGTVDHPVKVQALVDTGLLLSRRLPNEPILRGAARLAADQGAGAFFGGPWPMWTDLTARQLAEAKEAGEIYESVDPMGTAEVLVGAFTGMQLMALASGTEQELVRLTSKLYELILPGITMPAVLQRVDTSPARSDALLEQARAQNAAEPAPEEAAESA
ncbi:ScbR family autoregulator-binding transcription factor [Streptomyces filamentosus]|uniref:Gamma-butyrolactone-binding protein n=1 Tax=Streptomyces filamentosus TaxID=67294 RepID=A0A919BAH7_STRFL|nr:ScbR family autoregulator-binding transcription factor [Streptomyces filamentosus]KAA6211289.1 TetR/AcrR family transcriptional regulator [Streptomyces filamentosus]GHF78790.1 gamma-butyrolactone-binding protein [Streptomyces filamentosus]